LPIKVGQSVADLNAQQILTSIQTLFKASPFSGIQSVTVQSNGSTTNIGIQVGLQGQNKFLPINLQVQS